MTNRPAATAVPVPNNPLLPSEDGECKYVWQAIVVTNGPEANESMRKAATVLEEKGYEYTRCAPDCDDGRAGVYRLVLVYRKQRSPMRKEEVQTLETLHYQKQMLKLKMEIDQMSVDISKFRQENPRTGW